MSIGYDVIVSEEDVVATFKEIFEGEISKDERRVHALVGVSVYMVMYLWNRLVRTNTNPTGAQFKHLFWSLHYLKTYSTVDVCCTMFKTTTKTLRKWVWLYIDVFYNWQLDVVSTITYYILLLHTRVWY